MPKFSCSFVLVSYSYNKDPLYLSYEIPQLAAEVLTPICQLFVVNVLCQDPSWKTYIISLILVCNYTYFVYKSLEVVFLPVFLSSYFVNFLMNMLICHCLFNRSNPTLKVFLSKVNNLLIFHIFIFLISKIYSMKRDPPLFTGKLLIKFQNILRNTTQVIIRHRVKILFSVISSPITLERQKWK